MNLLPRRKRPRHTHDAVRVAMDAERAARPAAREPAPAVPPAPDRTELFRLPSFDGGPGIVIPVQVPSAWSQDADTLRKTAAAIRGLPAEPAPAEPGAYLRAIMPGDSQPWEPLHGSTEFAGLAEGADGRRYAGLYLGDEDPDGRIVIDATRRWLLAHRRAVDEALAALEAEVDEALTSLENDLDAEGRPAA